VSGGTFCATGTTTLTTTGAVGGTFSATPAGLVIDATTGQIDLAASTPNTYTITYSFGTAPCNGTATSQVTVSAQPAATVSGGIFCNSGTTTLAVTGTTGGTFSATPVGLVIDPATGVIDLGASAANTYTIMYSFGTAPCTGTATSQVTVSNNQANVVVTDPAAVCEPGTVDLTDPNITAGSTNGLNYTYWMDAANTVPLPDPSAVGVSGTYYITGTAPGGCSSTESVQVTVRVNKAPAGTTLPSVSTTPNTPTQLSARNLGIGYTYQWYPPVGINFNDIQNPTFNYNQPTLYMITLTPPDGNCPTVDTLQVKLDTGLRSSLNVPNAWSPNGDGHNDKLYPLTINMKELKYFRVYNRWGQLMFETSTLGVGWDGTYNGQPQVMDVYTWTVEATGLDGVHYKQAGNAILMR
jgi:gliding motility-associated-like protein